MRKQRELRRTKGLKVEKANYAHGVGEVDIGNWRGSVIWTTEDGWDHVSVAPYDRDILPSWEDMCVLKDMFFDEDETVVQFHPSKKEYVNLVKNCLHLWRPNIGELVIPPGSQI